MSICPRPDKRHYETRRKAQIVGKRMRVQGWPVEPYRCPCGRWAVKSVPLAWVRHQVEEIVELGERVVHNMARENRGDRSWRRARLAARGRRSTPTLPLGDEQESEAAA